MRTGIVWECQWKVLRIERLYLSIESYEIAPTRADGTSENRSTFGEGKRFYKESQLNEEEYVQHHLMKLQHIKMDDCNMTKVTEQ